MKKVKRIVLGIQKKRKSIRLTKGGQRFSDHIRSIHGETEEELLKPYEEANKQGLGQGKRHEGRTNHSGDKGGCAGGQGMVAGGTSFLIAPNGELLVESDYGEK